MTSGVPKKSRILGQADGIVMVIPPWEKSGRLTKLDGQGGQRFRNVLKTLGEDTPLGIASLSVPPMTDVTRILSAIEQGDPHAAEQLLPLVYEELRQLAAQ